MWQTLKRDLMAICKKFYYVFLPHESRTLLRDCALITIRRNEPKNTPVPIFIFSPNPHSHSPQGISGDP